MADQSMIVIQNPFGQVILIHLALIFDLGVLEFRLQNLGPVKDDSGFGAVGVVSKSDRFALSVSDLHEDVGILAISDHNNLRLGQKSREVSIRLDFLGGGSNLRLHVLDDSAGLARSIVIRGQFSLPKDFDSGIPGDGKTPASVLAGIGTVNLG